MDYSGREKKHNYRVQKVNLNWRYQYLISSTKFTGQDNVSIKKYNKRRAWDSLYYKILWVHKDTKKEEQGEKENKYKTKKKIHLALLQVTEGH